ncbi:MULTISPECIES: DUF3953 domain-containing protein [unclassified Lysinibacillus]|uniref:DUF3953 domain-containing protein n=1 Tax=unclassified Lysinibacillus TaxID=2636778 RepID=UPI002552E16A|nr:MULTISPECIES: DUF3953 domain-containing protein [unclassified Lysinibacillus]MDM5248293.1 DUF3953 domain-containing protein [Lysinibacillus sp. G4S2]
MRWNLSLGIQIILTVFVMIIGIYCLITKDFTLLPLSQILLGFTFIIIGLREWKRAKRKYVSILYFAVAIFILFVYVKSFIAY